MSIRIQIYKLTNNQSWNCCCIIQWSCCSKALCLG